MLRLMTFFFVLVMPFLAAQEETPWYRPSLPNHVDLPGITIETIHIASEQPPVTQKQQPSIVQAPSKQAKSTTPVQISPTTLGAKPSAQPTPHIPEPATSETPWEVLSFPNHVNLPDVTVETVNTATTPPPIVVDVPPNPQAEKTASPAEKLTAGSYRIRVGDIMVVSIYGEPTSKRPVTVDPTGCISYLFVNALPVKGITIGEMRLALEQKLKKYYKSPLVSITLVDSADEHFIIMGEVMQGGRYPILGNTSLLDAMAISGGFRLQEFRFETYDQADLTRSFLARRGQYLPIDFERLVTEGDLSQNVTLQDGDYVYISPSNLDKVYVLGEVRRPLYVQYLHTISLVEALAEAGGLNLRASSRVAVLRGSLACPTQYLIDINLILKGYACDFTLEPGDIVYVPPFRFNTAKEIIRSAISTFVGTVATVAGSRAFIATTPEAANTNLIQPVPVINLGGSFVTPVLP